MTEKVPKTSGKKREKKEATVNEPVKSKREKRRREETISEDNSRVNDAEESLQEPQKKKHRKNKTGYPDPQDDSALSEQACKALSYAFSQFRKPSKWKFSKARQNWLIRNVWSETIPDAYLSMTIQYLSNVKGGVRDTLIKECQSILSVSSTPPDKLASTETTEAQPGSTDQAVPKTG
ncbi:hypothetical protein DFH09DRAFT_32325 [Mycena vulgaris]|nr:hypothetical protein DFH09DRAFT_32325 [Mycena vulgaris]